jgi:hypothetical protein
LTPLLLPSGCHSLGAGDSSCLHIEAPSVRSAQRRNQRLYRKINARIREATQNLVPVPEEPVKFLCECGDLGCSSRIELTHKEWDFFASTDGFLLLAPAHTDVLEGRVVGEDPRFVVVAPN